jgi:superfamily II DNA/RNA helicase
VDDISHIFNYDVPDDPEVYVHRIGRTARMGEAGRAIMLVAPDQGEDLTQIEKLINREIPAMAVDDFKPSSPPPDAGRSAQSAPAKPKVLARNVKSRFGGDAAAVPVHRTLGSKFPPRRKRRL